MNRVSDIILFLNVVQNSGNSPVVMLSFYDNELNDPVVTESIPRTCFYTDQNQKRRTHVFSVGINFLTCGKAGTALYCVYNSKFGEFCL